MKRLTIFVVLAIATLFTNAQNYLLVGTYTTSGKSEGIHIYKFNSTTGESEKIGVTTTSNPSYLSISPNEKFVYAVHELDHTSGKGGEISAFSFDKRTGKMTLINSEPSGGDHPCYVQVDKTGKWVFAGNYTSGSLSVYPVKKNGGLGAPQVIQHRGSGANKDRQAGPHVHCTMISPDNKWLYVPDLGMDKVMIYSFNDKTGKLTPAPTPFAASEPGDGPRHFVFHPNGKYAYVIEELTGNIIAYKYNSGKLTSIQRISTIDKEGFAGSADIHVSPDGKYLYGTNRGDFNTIATFSIDAAGKLKATANQSTLGKTPRNFNLDPSGNFLLVANQNSDEIVVFKRNKATGALTDTGKRITVGQPVCIKWIKM